MTTTAKVVVLVAVAAIILLSRVTATHRRASPCTIRRMDTHSLHRSSRAISKDRIEAAARGEGFAPVSWPRWRAAVAWI